MRIAYLLTSLGIGGAERQVTGLARHLAQRGHTVVLLALRARAPEEWTAEVPIRYLGMRRTPWSVGKGLFQARRFLRGFGPDVIHSHGFHANLVNRMLSLGKRKPATLATIHNVYEGGWLRMLAYRVTDGLSDRTTAVSEAVAHRFVGLGAVSAQRCVVIRNAVELEELVPNEERRREVRSRNGAGGEFIWLAAGRSVPAKDYPTMLGAFARVKESRPGTQLWVAGQGSEADGPLRTLAGSLGLQRSVRFLGLRRDLPALLDGADGFVMSSAWEGMPLAIGEAMAMAKPVVATDVGGVRELTGEIARIVPSRNAEALASAMAAAMQESAGERASRGSDARERIREKFNMATRAQEWESFYRSAIEAP
ncbi:MAG: glycosyltransferase [Acidobacteriota bacterium]